VDRGPVGWLRSRWSRLDRYGRAFVALFVLAALLRVGVLALPREQLIRRFLVDDAYYAFAIVENVLDGHGVVFNRGVPTNGFHPLWPILMLPIFLVLGPLGSWPPIWGTLALLAVVNLATGVLVYRIGRRIEHPTAGLLAAGIWWLSPYLLRIAGVGLETPLQALLVALLLDRWTALDDLDVLAGPAGWGFGLLLGSIFLARMDAIFLIAVFGGLVIARGLQRDEAVLVGLQRGLRRLVRPAAATMATVLPWLAFSVLRVGRLTPVSGAATTLVREARGSATELAGHFALWLARRLVDVFLAAHSVLGNLLVVAFLFLGPVVWGVLDEENATWRTIRDLDLVAATAVLLVAYYLFVALGFRIWYVVFPAFVLALAGATLWIRLGRQWASPDRVAAAIGLVLLASFSISASFAFVPGQAPQELHKARIVQDVDERIPANATLGSFNTGVYQYYTPDRDVINMDGVVNPEAYEALATDRLPAFVDEQGVDYVLDPNRSADRLREAGVQLERVETYPVSWPAQRETFLGYEPTTGGRDYHLFRVVDPGSPSG
jgi:hypothetical protein